MGLALTYGLTALDTDHQVTIGLDQALGKKDEPA
jgi:hypothetical protein